MKGQILHLDEATGRGVIRAEGGVRFDFDAADLRGSGQVARAGIAVDFQTQGTRAIEIYPDPGTPVPVTARKSKVVAGILALLFGPLGAHKFYLGASSAGIIMLLASLFGWVLLFIPTWIVWVIGTVEALIYVTRSDEDFAAHWADGQRPWF